MKNTYSLKNQHHDINIDRFKTRLTAKCCVVLVCLAQIIIRIVILTTNTLTPKVQTLYIVTLPLLTMTALIVLFEYFLFRRIGPKVMKYSRFIDIVLLLIFTAEWMVTMSITLNILSVMSGRPCFPPAGIFAFSTFGWRILFLLFLIQGWKLTIVPPTLVMGLMMGYVLYYAGSTSTKMILLLGVPAICYTILMLYFLDKIKWKEVFNSTQQERWVQINEFVLNNIPENILILDLGGGVSFVSNYCRAFMQTTHLSENPQDLLTNICELSLQPETDPLSPSNNNSRQGDRATTMHCLLEPTGTDFIGFQKADTLESLIESFKTYINTSHLQEKEFLIYNGKLRVQEYKTKAIEIKISYVQQLAKRYIILIIRDTTQRDLLITLRDNNKYKDQLLASVSHELRTPLNGTLNLVESALQAKNLPIHVKENLLTPALRSSKFLLHLINDILDMSQIKEQKLRLIFTSNKLRDTLNDTMQLIELQAKKKGLDLWMEIHPEIKDSSICTDHVRLSQIVLNLLNNAIKFTQKGSILLSAMPTDEPLNFRISVRDSGRGMTQENIKKLFTDYTHIEFADRAVVNPTGVGLGLSIAYNLAKLLGPKNQQGITVQSSINIGSTFSFIVENQEQEQQQLSPQDISANPNKSPNKSLSGLELADELEVLEPKMVHPSFSIVPIFNTCRRVSSSDSDSSKGLRCACPKILIVDDNPFNTMAFEAVLGSLNFKCDSVFDGRAAIEKILERQKSLCGSKCQPYSVIFMDQEMPGMTGSETVQEIKKLEAQGAILPLKIIGCTAHNSAKEINKFMDAGIDMCIHKPISAQEVQRILKGYDT